MLIVAALFALAGGVLDLVVSCSKEGMQVAPPGGMPGGGTRTATRLEPVEVVYDGGLRKPWRDWGWGAHAYADGGAVRVNFTGLGGIVIKRSEPAPASGALSFRVNAPAEPPDAFVVALGLGQTESKFRAVRLEPRHLADVGGGWREALISMAELDPEGVPFDSIRIQATRPISGGSIPLDKILLVRGEPGTEQNAAAWREVRLRVDCDRPATPISPLIYGIAKGLVTTGETAHRIGGNPMTRLNWELGAWNTGSDWFFENVGDPKLGLWDWINDIKKNQVKLALVVPMIGWVAKDKTSVGFPRATFGEQRKYDPHRPEAGDGFRSNGAPIPPGQPRQTSVAATPETVASWIRELRRRDGERGSRGVDEYILDNEPELWHLTHRDVHPEPLSYDELLDRTLKYAAAIRTADPEAVIAGPAAWGWPAYFFSALDMAAGSGRHPDHEAHGRVPLLQWYLQKLAEHERTTGKRLLDVLDVHFYPQADGVYRAPVKTDADGSALRLRSTRALWDPTYKDESWVGDSVRLIPRLKEWIASSYPGRGISIGEWSFGAEEHISGGLAIAETLGRFGQQGIQSAYYWSQIPERTPAAFAFRSFRNFDGQGGHFLDRSVPTREAEGVSLFASTDAAGSSLVIVALNLEPRSAVRAKLDLASCGAVNAGETFRFAEGSTDFARAGFDPGALELPPYSITVLRVKLAAAADAGRGP